MLLDVAGVSEGDVGSGESSSSGLVGGDALSDVVAGIGAVEGV